MSGHVMTETFDYKPEVVAHFEANPGYRAAVENLAEVLDTDIDSAYRLAIDHDFIKAVARLAAYRVRLAVEWSQLPRRNP